MFGVKVTLSCFQQLPLNSNHILELFNHTIFEKGLEVLRNFVIHG